MVVSRRSQGTLIAAPWAGPRIFPTACYASTSGSLHSNHTQISMHQIPKNVLGTCEWTWKNRVFGEIAFFDNSGCNWGGLGVSGGSARGIRNFSLELWQDLVLHGIRKSTFQHSTVNWNFNVLEMALKTLHIFQGLSGTPLLFIPRYHTNIFSNLFEKRKSINLEI